MAASSSAARKIDYLINFLIFFIFFYLALTLAGWLIKKLSSKSKPG
jgi:hypothetical protein